MTIFQILLICIMVHLVCVIYMFNLFDSQGYVADEFDRLLVWLFAPEIIVIIWIKIIGGIK